MKGCASVIRDTGSLNEAGLCPKRGRKQRRKTATPARDPKDANFDKGAWKRLSSGERRHDRIASDWPQSRRRK
jgi:hypothetical protein